VDRRAELTDRALDYVLSHGLVGLSLRPLAAALGTSDRMLVYHFGSKEQLIGAVLDRAQQRLAAGMELPDPPPGNLRELVDHLWSALTSPAATRVTRLYLETCVLAVQDPARWRGAPERLRGPWRTPMRDGLVAFGVPADQADALADLILDTFDGLALHRLTGSDPRPADAAAAMFARLLIHDPEPFPTILTPEVAAGPSAARIAPRE
jgi:AcrR family transcriptional regulator